MDLGLSGKVALVTAASKGLGKASALALAAEGARVMIASRDEAALRRTAVEIGAATQTQVSYCPADLTRAGDISDLVRRTVAELGGVDVLVNSAGGPPAGGFAALDDAAWQGAFELNLLNLVRLIREVVPLMRNRGGGRIVNFASSSIKQPIDNLILSNTFRTAIVGLSKSLATELAPDNILINVLGPGRIATDRMNLLDQANAERLDVSIDEVRRRSLERIPLGRYGEPAEFARVAAFLASPANTYVTGQAFLADGGMVKAI